MSKEGILSIFSKKIERSDSILRNSAVRYSAVLRFAVMSRLKGKQGITMEKKNITYDLEERLIDFAVRIIRMAESLPKTKVANHIAGQLIRCGTSPAPNYGEAQSAESRADFI